MPVHYHRHSPSNQRSLGPFSSPSYNNAYPGIESLGDIPQLEASSQIPYQGGGEWIDPATTTAATVLPPATPAKTGFSLANIGELKGVIDRMGGIDGIVSSMGKFQKVMAGVQQMAPMIKLMMGTFGKGSTKSTAKDGDDLYYTPRKRRRKKSTTTQRKKTSNRTFSKNSRKSTPYRKSKRT
ncbi:hypothetical protein [Paenibacillus crassostreae]|uniref:Tyrosine protein kinase n=1 Tax=Paenibacillus crassostreae TaxID=1763538 RepID=A0A167ATY7_9BACL|nr:hypothetical protein [Paenibacillus crassostreae]AOZ93598.1 hypothetical protein LPB68_16310 [Paenibacillus crassostreae]OAB71424.1 hypothetical protein PNBC_19180 [Paenibacillus crassostreae]